MKYCSMGESQEKIIGMEFKVLNHGFVRVVDFMGSDDAIVQAARVSYGNGTKTKREDDALINYLMKHRHTSPFEMCEIKLHIKLPMFIARQWIRHRTANVNECSARYSVLPEEFYVPNVEDVLPQSVQNKQCRGGEISSNEAQSAVDLIQETCELAYKNYQKLLSSDDESQGIAREIARGVLPVNMFTEWYWKIDLHNLLHFIKLRIHPHAQYEIRLYAEILAKIVEAWCPVTYNAFQEYVLDSVTLSKSQINVLKKLIDKSQIAKTGLSKREETDLISIFE